MQRPLPHRLQDIQQLMIGVQQLELDIRILSCELHRDGWIHHFVVFSVEDQNGLTDRRARFELQSVLVEPVAQWRHVLFSVVMDRQHSLFLPSVNERLAQEVQKTAHKIEGRRQQNDATAEFRMPRGMQRSQVAPQAGTDNQTRPNLSSGTLNDFPLSRNSRFLERARHQRRDMDIRAQL